MPTPNAEERDAVLHELVVATEEMVTQERRVATAAAMGDPEALAVESRKLDELRERYRRALQAVQERRDRHRGKSGGHHGEDS